MRLGMGCRLAWAPRRLVPVSVPQVIEAAARKFGSKQRSGRKVVKSFPAGWGIHRSRRGFAAGFKNVGFSFGYQENSWAKVEIHGNGNIENVIVHHAGAEVGQGTDTVMAQMAAEVIGVTLGQVKLIPSDSAAQGNSGSSSASRMTFMAGNAIKGAAEAALHKWQNEERPAVAEFTYLAPKTTHFDEETGYSTPNFSYAYSAEAAQASM